MGESERKWRKKRHVLKCKKAALRRVENGEIRNLRFLVTLGGRAAGREKGLHSLEKGGLMVRTGAWVVRRVCALGVGVPGREAECLQSGDYGGKA